MDKKILKDIEKRIGEKRYNHSIRVANLAKNYANIFGENEQKAYIAGLLHDCGRILDKDKLLEKSERYGLEITVLEENNTDLLHSHLGAEIAKDKYHILDKDILDAIRYHTTGRRNMSNLEKIIYLADYTEPIRNFNGVDEVRKLCEIDLDRAMILALNQSIKFLIEKDVLISLDTIEARNYIKLERMI